VWCFDGSCGVFGDFAGFVGLGVFSVLVGLLCFGVFIVVLVLRGFELL